MRLCSAIIEAIRQFSWPANINGIQVWFGLVEQVSFSFSNPFHELLVKDADYVSIARLQATFDFSSQSIADKVLEGVKTFVTRRTTALVTDWSKEGIGFVLLQKVCDSLSSL